MVDRREHLRTTKAAAIAAKDAFVARYARDRYDRAVGLSLNEGKTEWVLKVLAHSPQAARQLPSRFDQFLVEVEIVGLAEAL